MEQIDKEDNSGGHSYFPQMVSCEETGLLTYDSSLTGAGPMPESLVLSFS